MMIFGFHAVISRIKRAPDSIEALYLDRGRSDIRVKDLLAQAQQSGVKPNLIDAERMERICPNRKHQGVVAMVKDSALKADLDDLLDSLTVPARLLLLDGVTDPRNLGACLRVADGAGVHAVIAPKDHAVTLTDVAVQTASGAADTVPYIMVTNLASTIEKLQDRNIWVYGTADEAKESLFSVKLPAAVAWVLGAEGTGLRRLTRERCDQLIHIPMAGQLTSLNVSVACGIVLYETMRQSLLKK